ncbi:hypothetical protein PAEPH01_2339 [Pancytospora epiphaga]|nr:hypothetical protein PAEPH01_2339 [Pancytospora epiphaga]
MNFRENKKRSFETSLDLDYDNFVTKKIERCDSCGDVYYKGIEPPHICGSADAYKHPTTITDPHANDSSSDTPSNTQTQEGAGLYEGTDRNLLCGKIYTIWEKSGFKRYVVEDEEPKSRDKVTLKDKFSFSPYDNFF